MTNSKQLNNKQFRQSLRDNPIGAMRAQGVEFDETKEYIVTTNTANLIYLVMPDESITHQDFAQIQAAGRIGTVGTVGSVGSTTTLGCACTCLSTIACAGTAGSAGSFIGVNIEEK